MPLRTWRAGRNPALHAPSCPADDVVDDDRMVRRVWQHRSSCCGVPRHEIRGRSPKTDDGTRSSTGGAMGTGGASGADCGGARPDGTGRRGQSCYGYSALTFNLPYRIHYDYVTEARSAGHHAVDGDPVVGRVHVLLPTLRRPCTGINVPAIHSDPPVGRRPRSP